MLEVNINDKKIHIWESGGGKKSRLELSMVDFISICAYVLFFCCLVAESCPTLFVTPWTVAPQAPL